MEEVKKMEKKKEQIKDRPVPPVKGAVTQMQDIVRKPAGIFGPEQLNQTANPLVFDNIL